MLSGPRAEGVGRPLRRKNLSNSNARSQILRWHLRFKLLFGISVSADLVEVMMRSFGLLYFFCRADALPGDQPRAPTSESRCSSMISVTRRRVMLKPGPSSDVMYVPTSVRTGIIFHEDSTRVELVRNASSDQPTYPAVAKPLQKYHPSQAHLCLPNYSP